MASAAQLALFDRRAPALAGEKDREAFIDDAVAELSSAQYGVRFDLACVLVAAHRMEMRARTRDGMDGSSAVSSQGEGFVNYATPNAKDSFWTATIFGLEYLDLRSRRNRGPSILDGRTSW